MRIGGLAVPINYHVHATAGMKRKKKPSSEITNCNGKDIKETKYATELWEEENMLYKHE